MEHQYDENKIKKLVECSDIQVILKDGTKISLDELNLEHVTTGVYPFWEYAGISNPLGQASATIINAINGALSPILNAIQGVVGDISSTVYSILNEVSNISSEVSNIVNFVQDLADRVSTIVTYIENLPSEISSFIQSAINTLREPLSNIQSILSNVVSYIEGIPGEIQGIISNLVSAVEEIPSEIENIVSNLINEVTNAISSLSSELSGFFSEIREALSSITTSIYDVSKTIIRGVEDSIGNIVHVVQQIYDYIVKEFKGISDVLSHMVHSIQSSFGSIIHGIESLVSNVKSALGGILSDITHTIANLPKAVGELVGDILEKFRAYFSAIMDGVTSIGSAFKGFINPLVEIKNWLTSKLYEVWSDLYNDVLKPIYTDVANIIAHPIKTISSFFSDVEKSSEELFKPVTCVLDEVVKAIENSGIGWIVNELPEEIISGIKSPVQWLEGSVIPFLDKVWTSIVSGAKWIYSKITESVNTIQNIAIGFISGAIMSLSKQMKFDAVDIVFKPIVDITGVNEWAKRTEGFMQFVETIGKPIEPLYTYYNLATYSILNTIPKGNVLALMISTVILGLSGVLDYVAGELSVIFAKLDINISLKDIGKAIPKIIYRAVLELVKTLMFTTSFWLYEPFKYWVNPFVRYHFPLPVEIPTYPEMVRSTRRFLPCYLLAERGKQNYRNMFNAVISELHRIMDYRAYPFWFELMTLGKFTPQIVIDKSGIPTLLEFTVEDRFGFKRNIPMALLYELPTPSDTIRMMMRDVIINLDQFELMMASHGFNKDVTALYYLLHFKYPSPTNLFEFATRLAGEVTWFEAHGVAKKFIDRNVKQFTEWKLGYPPKTPSELTSLVNNINLPKPTQVTQSIDTSKIDSAVVSRFNQVVGYILPYYKWHNYFPMSWIPGWTSDQMMAIELSAEIPTRLDARWMFKWCIITDTDLLRIVMSRGMHPQWVTKIAIGEMMNALNEERNLVRSSILSAYKYGLLTEDTVSNLLSHLCDVNILGLEIPVRFLPSEVKLLTIRADYDRAIEIIRSVIREMNIAYAENLISFDEYENAVNSVITAVNNSMGLQMVLDGSFFNPYKEYLDAYKDVDTFRRVRAWIRYSMYQLLYRFMRGFVPSGTMKQILDTLVELGKLTPAEKGIFEVMMQFMVSGYVNEVEIKAVLRELERGAITLDTAKKRLISLGMSDKLADAMIEAYAKHYTLSVSTLLSYADYVEIPEEILKQKMQILGVPEKDQKIILEVFKIKPVRSEMNEALRQLLEAFSNGYITEKELENAISKYGISRVGLNFLILAYKIRRENNDAKLYIDALIHKFKRGAISLSDLEKEIIKIVHDRTTAELIIEKNARVYELSVDKLIQMREYVPISTEWIINKAKEFGYPENEIKILPAYSVAREISSEVTRLANELGEDFVYGVITEQEFRQALDQLATLNGEVKRKLGVDWIVLSPEERDLLVTLYKLRRLRHEKSRRRG